jgi:hypothetical protein
LHDYTPLPHGFSESPRLIDALDSSGRTVLFSAVKLEDSGKVESLLAAEADRFFMDENAESLIYHAIVRAVRNY